MSSFRKLCSNELTEHLERFSREKSAGNSIDVFKDYILSVGKTLPLVEFLTWNNSAASILIESKYSKRKLSLKSNSTPQSEALNIRSLSKRFHNDEDDQDLTGNPLLCPFNKTDDDITDASPYRLINTHQDNPVESLCPVAVNAARLLLSKIYMSLSQSHLVLPTVWIATDGLDESNTAVIGCYKSDNCNYRVNITSTGPFQNSDQLPTLSNIQNKHLRGIDNSTISWNVSASYSVLLRSSSSNDEKLSSDLNNVFDDDVKNNNSLKCSRLTLKTSWKKVSTLLESPPFDAVTELNAFVVAGNENSVCYSLFKELEILQNLAGGLDCGEMSWIQDGNGEDATEKLTSFFQGQRDRYLSKKSPGVTDSLDFDSCFESKIVGKRDNLDFTDHLWNISKTCTSYESLSRCFRHTFKTLLNGDMIPIVFQKNRTQIANFVRKCLHVDVKVPSLDGVAPIELLLEIGIEKLKRDYTTLFVASELMTYEHVNNLLPTQEQTLTERVDSLSRLHLATELVTECKTSLMLSKDVLGPIARKASQHYKDLRSIGTSANFFFCLPSSLIKDLRGRLVLNNWTVRMISSDDTRQVQTVVDLSTSPRYPHVNDINDNEEIGEKNQRSAPYYRTTLTSIEDRII